MEENDGKGGTARSADEKFCFACGRLIHVTARDCPHCGAAQAAAIGPSAAAEPITGSELVPLAERAILADQVFCRGCGKPIHKTAPTCPHCGAPQTAVMARGMAPGQKNRTTAGILAIFLGGLGIHKFYLDEAGLGILYLLFCWTFIPALVGLVEGVVYLSMSDERFARKYG
jgi:TM2 domain-containing membrane protein YozV/predicted RNA-binding Zn-ribbon protein involved in translation (DUF1610 family)